MGYSTTYTLEWKAQKHFKAQPNCEHNPKGVAFCPECGTAVGERGLDSQVAAYIKATEEMTWAIESDGGSSESCKWYDHDKDMRAMSKEFPGVLFTLNGEGEESGDIWRKYYLDGKGQDAKAVIQFPTFDPMALK